MLLALPRPAITAAAVVIGQGQLLAAPPQLLDEHLVKAKLLESMIGFVTWPSVAGRGNSEPFRVGFFGRTGVAREYAKLAKGAEVLHRRIEVSYIGVRDNLESFDLVFIAEGEQHHAPEIAARLAGKPVLTVCDGRNGAAKGAILCLFILEEKIRYDVNLSRARQAGFTIHSQVLHYAEKVHLGGAP